MSTENMELWNRRQETDPAHVKHVDQRGGFHTIDAQYQLRNATDEWGPYGAKWGIRNCKYDYVSDDKGIAEVFLEAEFYYPLPHIMSGSEVKKEGSFEVSTDIQWRAGNECRKKLLTDLRSKALSLLGFNADVYLGAFDGNRYGGDDGHTPRKEAPQRQREPSSGHDSRSGSATSDSRPARQRKEVELEDFPVTDSRNEQEVQMLQMAKHLQIDLGDLIRECSAFQGKDGSEIARTSFDKLTDKWMKATWSKARKLYKDKADEAPYDSSDDIPF